MTRNPPRQTDSGGRLHGSLAALWRSSSDEDSGGIRVKLGGTGIWNARLARGDPGEMVEAAGELNELGYIYTSV
jgi:hypothetical protein